MVPKVGKVPKVHKLPKVPKVPKTPKVRKVRSWARCPHDPSNFPRGALPPRPISEGQLVLKPSCTFATQTSTSQSSCG